MLASLQERRKRRDRPRRLPVIKESIEARTSSERFIGFDFIVPDAAF
jgi:hypothetical protein